MIKLILAWLNQFFLKIFLLFGSWQKHIFWCKILNSQVFWARIVGMTWFSTCPLLENYPICRKFTVCQDMTKTYPKTCFGPSLIGILRTVPRCKWSMELIKKALNNSYTKATWVTLSQPEINPLWTIVAETMVLQGNVYQPPFIYSSFIILLHYATSSYLAGRENLWNSSA